MPDEYTITLSGQEMKDIIRAISRALRDSRESRSFRDEAKEKRLLALMDRLWAADIAKRFPNAQVALPQRATMEV